MNFIRPKMNKMQKEITKTTVNYHKMTIACDKMRNSQNFDFKQLQRVLRPYCKTLLSDDNHLRVCLKGTQKSISIQLVPSYTFQETHYFKINGTSLSKFEIHLSALSSLELMKKINKKFEFLKP